MQVKGPHELTFVDYPGERLLDAGLTQKSYAKWSDDVLGRLSRAGGATGTAAAAFSESSMAILADTSPNDKMGRLGLAYGACAAAQQEGIAVTPTQPLLAGGDNVQTPFAPLAEEVRGANPAVCSRMESRYKEYVRHSVQPFLDRIGACTHQIVLVDILDILRTGPLHHNRVRQDLGDILMSFDYMNHGNGRVFEWLARLWNGGKRYLPFLTPGIQRVTFCCTKADQATRANRHLLVNLLQDFVETAAVGINCKLGGLGIARFYYCSANRGTKDAMTTFQERNLSTLIGVRKGCEQSQPENVFPGEVPPEWPTRENWNCYRFPDFLPARLPEIDGVELPHIHMDKVLYDIFEDYLR